VPRPPPATQSQKQADEHGVVVQIGEAGLVERPQHATGQVYVKRIQQQPASDQQKQSNVKT